MTTINTSSLNLYTSPFSLASKTDQDKASEGATTVGVNLRATASTAAGGAAKEDAAPKSPMEEAIDQLKARIAETQKRLQEEIKQMMAAQSSKAPEEIKAQQVMAIQQQISGTTAELAAEQASLMKMMQAIAKATGVNTTA